MKYEIIEDESALWNFQKKFEQKLIDASDRKIGVTIGWKGESQKTEVYYSESLDIWFKFDRSSSGTPRYWNAFGVGEPRENSGISITCELNFPIKGKDLRVAGVPVKDEDTGELLVCYTGKLGGSRRGTGKNLFWAHYSGKSIEVDGMRLALIGSLGSVSFAQSMRDFVLEVSGIKNVRSG